MLQALCENNLCQNLIKVAMFTECLISTDIIHQQHVIILEIKSNYSKAVSKQLHVCEIL